MTPAEALTRLGELASTDHHDGVMPAELGGYAAELAVRDLLDKWQDFARDGAPVVQFLGDVEDVIRVLTEYRDAVAELFQADVVVP
jgi:hypothetical protein